MNLFVEVKVERRLYELIHINGDNVFRLGNSYLADREEFAGALPHVDIITIDMFFGRKRRVLHPQLTAFMA